MHVILRKILKVFLFLTTLLLLKSVKWALRLAKEKFSLRDLESFRVQNGHLIHNETGLELTDEIYNIVKGGLIYWKSLVAYSGISKMYLENGILHTEIDELTFQIDHPGTMFVLDEIFQERLYDIRVNEDLIVLDIGMNVGAASLYFAKWKYVQKVYGFEPLPATYEQAQQNFKINSNIADKIVAEQKGVGASNGKITVPYEKGGSAVFSTDRDFINTIGNQSSDNIEVEIISIQNVLESISKMHPETRIFLKLDCEGEEYKIIRCMDENNLFKKISCIALEWHFKGYEELCQILQKNYFSVFNLGRKEIRPYVGMIYAFNMKLE